MTHALLGKRRWLAAAILTLGIATACGGDDKYETLQEFVDDFAVVYCNKVGDCGQLPDGTSVSQCIQGYTEDTCSRYDCTSSRPDDLSVKELEKCLDDTEAQTCPLDAENPVPESCDFDGPSVPATRTSRSAWGSAAAR